MLDGLKSMHVQPFMSNRPVEPLDVGVLCRLSWLNIEHRDLILDAPIDHCLTDMFRAVVPAE